MAIQKKYAKSKLDGKISYSLNVKKGVKKLLKKYLTNAEREELASVVRNVDLFSRAEGLNPSVGEYEKYDKLVEEKASNRFEELFTIAEGRYKQSDEYKALGREQ